MKTSFLCLLFLVAACPQPNNATDLSGAADLAVADLTVVPTDGPSADLAQLSCLGINTCIAACPLPSLSTCIPACIALGSSTALTYFVPLQACSGPACNALDGGVPPCADPASVACQTCVFTNCGTELTACLGH